VKLGLLITIHESSLLDERAFRTLVEECYTPLFRLIKNNHRHRFSISIDFSFLQLLNTYGYLELLATIKQLYSMERVELVGSVAHGALLADLSEDLLSAQIVLNEYALAHFFGSHQSFEGDKGYMIKNIAGFYPTKFVIDEDKARQILEMGYEWIPVKSTSADFGVRYELKAESGALVSLDDTLSDLIAGDISKVADYLKMKGDSYCGFACVDSQAFWFRNKEGVAYLDLLLTWLLEKNIELSTVSSLVGSLKSGQLSEFSSIADAGISERRKQFLQIQQDLTEKFGDGLLVLEEQEIQDYFEKKPATLVLNMHQALSGDRYEDSLAKAYFDLFTQISLGL